MFKTKTDKLGAYLKANYNCKAFFDGEDYSVHPLTPLPDGVSVTEEAIAAWAASHDAAREAEQQSRQNRRSALLALRDGSGAMTAAQLTVALRALAREVLGD